MEKYKGTHFLLNNQIFDVCCFQNVYLDHEQAVYEVIRIIEGVPLFIEKHIERLFNSAADMAVTLNFSSKDITKQVSTLIEVNKLDTGNIKLVLQNPEERTGEGLLFYSYYIPHHYPSKNDYQNGIAVTLIELERPNPNIKKADFELRRRIDAEIARYSVYEGLLVDSKGNITEGSRSNIFFIKNDKILTSDPESILPGITRSAVIDVCQNLGYQVIEKKIPQADMPWMDAVFITGTSPKVLPVKIIDDYLFTSASHPMVQRIMSAYDKLIDDYVQDKKHLF